MPLVPKGGPINQPAAAVGAAPEPDRTAGQVEFAQQEQQAAAEVEPAQQPTARVEPAQQPTAEVVVQAQPNQPPSNQPFQVILKSTDLVNQAIIVIMEPTDLVDRHVRMRFELRETVNPPTRLRGVGSGKLLTWPSKVMGGASGGSTLELTRANSWSTRFS